MGRAPNTNIEWGTPDMRTPYSPSMQERANWGARYPYRENGWNIRAYQREYPNVWRNNATQTHSQIKYA